MACAGSGDARHLGLVGGAYQHTSRSYQLSAASQLLLVRPYQLSAASQLLLVRPSQGAPMMLNRLMAQPRQGPRRRPIFDVASAPAMVADAPSSVPGAWPNLTSPSSVPGAFPAGPNLTSPSSVAGAWLAGPDLPSARTDHAVTSLGGRLFAVGGRSWENKRDQLAVTDVFDPASGKWASGPNLNTARMELGVAALGGKLYAVGGVNTTNLPKFTPLTSVEVLDPAAASPAWVPGPSLKTGRAFFALAALDGKLYAVGGAVFLPTPGHDLASVEAVSYTHLTLPTILLV